MQQSGQQVFWYNEIKKFRKRRTRTSLEKRGRTKKRRKDVSWEGEGGNGGWKRGRREQIWEEEGKSLWKHSRDKRFCEWKKMKEKCFGR